MSRHTVSNLQFAVVFGVDHVTSTFVQVYNIRDGNKLEDGEADIVIDNQGVRVRKEILELGLEIEELEQRFSRSSHGNNLHPEDVIKILEPLGLNKPHNIDLVWEALD